MGVFEKGDEHIVKFRKYFCNDDNGAWCSLVCQNCSLGRTDGKCCEVGLGQAPARI